MLYLLSTNGITMRMTDDERERESAAVVNDGMERCISFPSQTVSGLGSLSHLVAPSALVPLRW